MITLIALPHEDVMYANWDAVALSDVNSRLTADVRKTFNEM